MGDFNYNNLNKSPYIPSMNSNININTDPKQVNLNEIKKPQTAKSSNKNNFNNNVSGNIITVEKNNNQINNLKTFESKIKSSNLNTNNNNENSPKNKTMRNKNSNDNNKIKNERFISKEKIPVNKSENLYNNNKTPYSNSNLTAKDIQNNFFAFQEQCAKQYERNIKTSHQNRSKNTLNSREVNYKMLESDIFFFKNTNEEKKNIFKEKKNLPIAIDSNINNNNKKDSNPYDSDIFLLKNNEKSLKKIGEKFLFSNKGPKEYHCSQKSNSEWKPNKIEFKSFVNYHSCDYDIVKPEVAIKIHTRNEILKEANGVNPAKIQKGLCEFNDLGRISNPNPNREYVKAIQGNEKLFLKKNNMCSDFLNLYTEYSSLCEKPFHRNYILK